MRWVKNVLTDNFSQIYSDNASKYSEEILQSMNIELSDQIRDFTHQVYINRESAEKLDSLYNQTGSDIICCFYYRYWIIINLLKKSQQFAPDEEFPTEEDDEALLYQLLFDVVGL